MSKDFRKVWRKRSLAAVLSLALCMQSTVVGYAAEMTSEIVTENETKEVAYSQEEQQETEISETGFSQEEQQETETMETLESTVSNNQTEKEELRTYSEEEEFIVDANGVLIEYHGTESNVSIPENVVEIGVDAFTCNTVLETVTLPQGLKKIGVGAFQHCTALKEIIFPESVESIGNYAFNGCTSLEKVTLNEGLRYIGADAFQGVLFGKVDAVTEKVTEYATLIIPSTVQSIGGGAFSDTKYLKEVYFADGENEILEIDYVDYGDGLFCFGESLTNVVLPERLTTITKEMFWNCANLKTVELGSKVTIIEEEAFEYCVSLETIELPEGLVRIENNAFRDTGFGSKNETTGAVTYGTLAIPGTVEYIGKDVFAETYYLKEIVFENGSNQTLVIADGTIYDMGTFGWSKSLEKVLLPKRLQKLPDGAFYYCSNLKTVYIPKTVTEITRECDQDTFDGCNHKKLVIYGETGSEAQQYAKDKGITFKNSSALGLFPTGLLLNRKMITVSGETAIGKTYALKATVKPSTAQNKAVICTSGNQEVATVDENGVVTITGYGETDITVTSVENDAVSANCHITVLRQWSEEELNATKQYITEHNNFVVVSNVHKDLQEVEINVPEGVKAQWRLPYEIGTGTKKYDVVLQKEGYVDTVIEDIEVTGIKVTGVKLECASQVEPGKVAGAKAELLTSGGTLTENDYQITWKSSNSRNVSVEENADNTLGATVTGVKKSSNANVMVKVVLKKDENACSTAKADKGVTWFETTAKVKVTNYVIVDDITVNVEKDGNTIVISDLSSLTNLTDKQQFILTTENFGKGEKVDAALTWKSSNTGVASVKTAKDGTVTLTVSNKGTAVITAIATKNGGYAESFRVTVKDSTPRLVEKNIAVNLYKTDAAEHVQILSSDGYEVQADSLQMVTSKGEEAPFTITCEEGNIYKISVKDSQRDNIKTGNHSVKILAKTSAGEEVAHELALKIKVEKKLPKVTIKQGSIVSCENEIWEVNSVPGTVNLYEKNAHGVIWAITEGAQIADISYVAKDGEGNPRIVEAEESLQSKGSTNEECVLVKTVDVNKTNYTKTKNKGTITVSFEGYLPEAVYKKNIAVAVNKKLPVIMAVSDTNTLYPETVADVAWITLVNKATNEKLSLDEGYTTEISKKPTGCASEIDYVQNYIKITALKNAKSGNVEHQIRHESWLDDITVSAKFALKIGKVPTLSFENSKVTLNAGYTLDTYDGVDIGAYVKGTGNLEWKNITVKGKDKNSEQVLKEKAISVFLENGKIKAGITDGSYFSKAGNYNFEITAYTDNEVVSGSLKVAVALPKNKPVVTLKTKGNIDLLDRENSMVTITPTVKNYTGKVVDIDLYSAYADKFETAVEDGVIIIKAQKNEILKTKFKYTLHMYVTLDSGVRLPATVKVTPKQTNPKLVQNVKEIVLFETAKGINYGKEFVVDTITGQQGEIRQIRLATENDTFGYDETTDTVFVKDTASLKPGKKYTLKFDVIFEDAGTNEKPVTVSLKVDYRK